MPHVSHYSRGVMVNAEKQEDFRGEKRSVMGELESRLSRSSIRDDKGCFPPPPPVFQTYAAQLAGKEQDQDMVESNTNKNMVESNTNKNMMESNTNKKTDNLPFPTRVSRVSINNNTYVDGKANEKKISQSSVGSPRKYIHKKCASCSEPVITGGGYANGQLFHQDCFKCSNCNAKLEGKFFTKEKKPFCPDCYKIYEKKCDICGDSIITDCVESNLKFYHSHCMKCSVCDLLLEGNYFILSGKFLCEADYKRCKKVCGDCGDMIDGVYYTTQDNTVLCMQHWKARQGNCKRCGKMLEGNILKLPGGSYHTDCFTCKVCNVSLAGEAVSVDDKDEIYCSDDYDRMFAVKCGSCKMPIVPVRGETTAPRLRALGQDFHPECFKCQTCGVMLEDGCYPLDKKPYCIECFEDKLNNC